MTAHRKPIKPELRALASNVTRLSELLTRERERIPSPYLNDAGLRTAYLAYFLPSNRAKINMPLGELLLHSSNLFAKRTIRVADIGSGPGSALLGLMDFFYQQGLPAKLEITAIDQVAGNLKEVEQQFKKRQSEFPSNASLQTIRSDIKGLDRLIGGRFDVVILSNVLNELYHNEEKRAEKRVELLCGMMEGIVAEDGCCMIIEPALRETSRELLQIRDLVLELGLNVYSPCLLQGKCPALINPRDWCHEDIPWDAPVLVRELDALTGLRKDSLKFSYLVLRKDGRTLADMHGQNAFRIVSEPLVSKGKLDFYICGKGGRFLATRLNKDETEANKPFGVLRRGNIAVISGLIDEDKRWKVGKNTTVVFLS